MDEELTTLLSRHAGFGNKHSGSAGDMATAGWISSELETAGFQITQQPVTVPVNRVEHLSLTGGNFTLYAQPNMIPGTVTAPLVVIHDAVQASRASGAIAVLVLPYARHSTLWLPPVAPLIESVMTAGAKALIVLATGPSGDILGLNTYADRAYVPVPLVMGKPDELPQYLALAGRTVTLSLQGHVEHVASPNVIAQRRAGPRWIAVSTPRTGFFSCLTERGSGTAAFLAMARRLPALYPDHSLFLMNTTGHELAFAGTHEALKLAPPPKQTDVWVHIGATLAANDKQEVRNGRMTGTADPNRVVMATPAMKPSCAIAFRGLSGLDDTRDIVRGAGELSAIADLGYTHAFAVLGQSRWFHTPQDTLDKLDPALLAPVVDAHLAALDAGVRAHHR